MRPSSIRHDRPLDRLFAAPSHVAILRALADWDDGLNTRELGRVAGLTHQAGRLAVARLLSLGVVRCDGVGRSRRTFLAKESGIVRAVVAPMLEAEKRFLKAAEIRRHRAFLARARAVMGRS